MKRGGGAILALVAILLVAVALFADRGTIAAALRGNWDFVKSVEVDRGSYFRLKVKLAYRGEPQDFDIVVGCNVRQINYMDGGRTVETGLVPAVFGRRMRDGKGLVVRPPAACRGETTANGDVPPDLLPVVIVYDDAETLGFGTAYLSEDAYESPLSVLTFGGASIEPAQRTDFDAFRREQPNLVKPASFHTPRGTAALKAHNLTAAPVPFGSSCHGYARFRLSDAEQERARSLWPADHPRFWLPTNWQDASGIGGTTDRSRPSQTDHDDAPIRPIGAFLYGVDAYVANLGLPTRRGGGVIHGSGGSFPPSYYPNIGSWIALPWPTDPPSAAQAILRDGPRVEASIDFREGATRGFAFCRSKVEDYGAFAAHLRKPATDLVDGGEVVRVPADPRGNSLTGPRVIVERDQFVFILFQIFLESTRGDV